MKVSICIPTYEANGLGVKLLKTLIDSIIIQTYPDIEIIISDHSINDEIKKYTELLNLDNLKYLKYSEHIGKPAYNTNNAILNSSGDLIKIMNMDDYFSDSDTIEKMVALITNEFKWSLCGFKHKRSSSDEFYNYMIPKIIGDGLHLLKGVNLVGCPSVGLFPRNVLIDPEVSYIIDCELWYRLFIQYGPPGIVNEYKIVITTGDHSLTNKLLNDSKIMIDNDTKYCFKKFNL